MYIHFSRFFSIIGYYKILEFPVLHSKSLLLCNCFLNNNINLYKIQYFFETTGISPLKCVSSLVLSEIRSDIL